MSHYRWKIKITFLPRCDPLVSLDIVFIRSLAASGVKMFFCLQCFEKAVNNSASQPALGCEDDGLNFE